MKRNLRLVFLLTILAMAFVLIGHGHQAAATTCDPEIPCGCCTQNCFDQYNACIASGTNPSTCASQRDSCLRICKFCV
jgi:hypothetical protein